MEDREFLRTVKFLFNLFEFTESFVMITGEIFLNFKSCLCGWVYVTEVKLKF